MNAAQTHLASCYAHTGHWVSLQTQCVWAALKCVTVTTRHILDEQMGKWAAREKQETRKTFELPAIRTLD
jgi:hypothetical protein